MDGAILIVVVLASIFGVSYALARRLHGIREKLIEGVVREVERCAKWNIYTNYVLPRAHRRLLEGYRRALLYNRS